MSIQYIWADAKKNKKNVFIGVFTIVLVLSCVCLLQNAIAKSPIIFLKIAENQSGEFDLLLTPRVSSYASSDDTSDDPYASNNSEDFDVGDSISSSSTQLWLNETEIREKLGLYLNFKNIIFFFFFNLYYFLDGIESIMGSSPRWVMLGRVFNANNHTHNGTIIILVMDSEQEEKIGVGREWNRRPLGYQETYISNSALRQINVQPNMGERVHIGVDLLQLASTFGVCFFFFINFII